MVLSSRWIALITFIVLTIIIQIGEKATFKEKIKNYGITIIEGMVGGLIIDSIGVNAGYYYFPRQPLYSLQYFMIVIPCWGLFGLLVNYLWDRLGSGKFIKGMIVTLIPLFAYYEGANVITGSWVYTTPIYAVMIGWIPLIIVFAGCRKRRRVVYKIDRLIEMCNKETVIGSCIYYALITSKVLVTIVMFPLLITRIYKVVVNIKKLNRMGYTTKDYIEYLMVS